MRSAEINIYYYMYVQGAVLALFLCPIESGYHRPLLAVAVVRLRKATVCMYNRFHLSLISLFSYINKSIIIDCGCSSTRRRFATFVFRAYYFLPISIPFHVMINYDAPETIFHS